MKLRIFRNLLLLALIFCLGFLTHALFFPDVLANGFTDVASIVIPIPTPTQGPNGSQYDFQTTITYKEGHFSRHNIVIRAGNYLSIKNIAQQHPMWLISNDPQLTTVRGYGDSEQVRERMDTKGQFVVEDKNNPQEKLVITVK